MIHRRVQACCKIEGAGFQTEGSQGAEQHGQNDLAHLNHCWYHDKCKLIGAWTTEHYLLVVNNRMH